MKPKEFANEFGVSVNEMCKITELTRQGLNDILSCKIKNKKSKARRIAVLNLREYGVNRRKQEIEKANEDYERRMKMIEIFSQI